jgi:TetR/AcrR family transcriptional regulator
VSAALPAYFFGGKRALYEAVLERLLSEREQRLEPLAARAADELERTGELRPALELLIDGYLDFLRERTALVRLMGREALAGGRHLAPGPRHSVAVAGGLARFLRSLSPPSGPAVDPEQLLISVVALCFFPIEHNDTMLAAMGLDAAGAGFAAARKRHVVDVLERVLRRVASASARRRVALAAASRAPACQHPEETPQQSSPVTHTTASLSYRRRSAQVRHPA